MKRTCVTARALTLPLAGANAQQWSTHALPAGLIAWWAAEGNLLDAVGAHHGDGSAAPTFAPERMILPTVGHARDRLSYNQGSNRRLARSQVDKRVRLEWHLDKE